MNRPFLRILSLACIAAFAAGCARDVRYSRDTAYLGESIAAKRTHGPDTISYWDGDGVSGSPSILIDLSDQRAYFYKGGTLVGVSLVSTGREGFDTAPGNFKIIQKSKDHKSNLYGNYVDAAGNIIQKDVDVKKHPKPPGAFFDGASMPYFMRVFGGVGMHAGFLPGYPASHGCIRMPEFMAEAFFRNAPLGTPVTIRY